MKELKLIEFSKEELYKQYKSGEIDIDYMCEYISTRDRVYNKLIDNITQLDKENMSLRTRIKTIKRLRKKASHKKRIYKDKMYILEN